jgi:Na+(H+)/acetate symporter ActP
MPYMTMMILGAVFVLVYTLLGGFLAESASDFMQAIVMIIALTVIVAISTVRAGGIEAVMANSQQIPGFMEFFGLATPVLDANGTQLLEAGKPADYDQIFDEIQKRDYQDSHRDYHPLKQADDAVLLDTSDMTKEENIEAVIDLIREKTGEDFAGLHAVSE